MIALMMANGLVSMSGALVCQSQKYADIGMGTGAIVIGLAAVIVGEALCAKATANFAVRLIFVVIGAIVYWLVYQTVIFLGLPSELLKMLSALVVAIFLGAPYLKKTYFSNHKKKGGAVNA
jgi:putative ABC transport system permease protein